MLQVNSLQFNLLTLLHTSEVSKWIFKPISWFAQPHSGAKNRKYIFLYTIYSWRLCFFNSVLSKVCFQVTKDILTILNFVRKWKTYSLQLFYSIDDHQHLTCWAGNSMSERSLNRPFNIDWSLSKDKLLFRLPWVLE